MMAKSLLEWETIDADQINDIMAGKEPRPPKAGSPPPRASGGANDGGVEPAAAPA